MPSLDRRRRRRRRRLSRRTLIALAGVVVGALVVALLVGGLFKVRGQSVGYERAVDRSYAAQARLLAASSNRLRAKFHSLLAAMPADDRTTLQIALDTLVRSTASLAQEAATAATPAPSGGAGADVATAMEERATAMLTLRTAVDRLLGMTPLRVAGAPDPPKATAVPRPLTSAGAAKELTKVGLLLGRSDRSYAAGRRALRAAPGRAHVPASLWSGRTAAWTSNSTLALVDALTGSSSLAVVHRVELVTQAIALTPAPVPAASAGAGGGVAVLPPTGHVDLAIVVADDGDVAERGIVVHATITPSGGTGGATAGGGTDGATHPRTHRASLALTAHSSQTVTLPAIAVVPGRSYTVVVTVDPPVANEPGTVTSDTVSIRVAPPSPPSVGELEPSKGPAGGDVTILGTGFTWVRSVTFGSAAARFKVVSSTQITAIAPPGTGTVAVRVSNPAGPSATSTADRFRYQRKAA